MWGATWSVTQLFTLVRFQSTLPVWGATLGVEVDLLRADISIHAPRVGSDAPHLGCRGERANFNPRSPCGERRPRPSQLPSGVSISIHAPRVGSDSPFSPSRSAAVYFNPRSPCGERPRRRCTASLAPQFQSTLPVWGATSSAASSFREYVDFNPRSPCGERPQCLF